MGERVKAQDEYLIGLQLDQRDWRRSRTQVVKERATAVQKRLLLRRLAYGSKGSKDASTIDE